MNRIIIGAATLLIVLGGIFLVSRSLRRAGIGQVLSRPTPLPSSFLLPSQQPSLPPGSNPVSTPFYLSSPYPSPTLLPQNGSQLPATGI